ncbi:MAG: hypothetical protein M1839_003244 [Geoglossum umbratile]|nr:MAG: hypothetical protein M1839_003244 [Geoglossum umbratile]
MSTYYLRMQLDLRKRSPLFSSAKNLVLKLILALQDLPAAWVLPSKNATGVLLDDIVRLPPRVISGKFDVPQTVTLCERVVSNASSTDIWGAVYDLVTESKATTPPTVFNKATLDTPFKSTSGSQQGTEQTHGDIDDRILQEVDGCTYNNTGGFYEKYFEGKSWSSTAGQIAQAANSQIINGRWIDYPNPPSQSAFLDWFWRFQSTFLLGRSMYYTSYKKSLNGSDCDRQPDLFLAPSGTTKCNGRYNWLDVRVIGELKESISKNYPKDVYKSTYAPISTWLVIRGSMVELWVFDRSGPYSCGKFDLHEGPDRFIKVMAGYTMMSDEELGLNTYIMFKGRGETKEQRLYLEEEPIAFQRAIVCRGTTCYRARRPGAKDWEFVVKFSWRLDKRRAEGELLQLAKERGVWGVARLFGCQDLTSIAELRQGLQFGKPRTFPSASGSFSQTQPSTKSGHPKNSRSRSAGLGISRVTLESSSSSGWKRKRTGEAAEIHQPKRSRSGSSRRRTDITRPVTAEQDGSAKSANKYSVEEAKSTSLLRPRNMEDESFDNRIFCCLVVSPPGRAINEFGSVEELLEMFRDAIKGHRSLYQDGKILHRDISLNNLIITDAENEEDPRGMLIDLDLAKELDSGPSGARHRTGTMEFMAIEVLKGMAHTYRHDLESFFYVFLWVIIRYGQETDKNLPKKSRLRDWYKGTYDQIARIKKGDMSEFEEITAEFPPMFEDVKGLAEELRDILFGTGRLFTGTYKKREDLDRMYDGMINAFEKTIEVYGHLS